MKSKRAQRPVKKSKARSTARPERGRLGVKARPSLQEVGGTKTEAAMAERLDSMEPGSLRYTALASAIDFKRSWVHLAKHLAEVMRAGAFKEWGFRTFEAYAQHELHLRRETAQKLVRSYDFLASHEKRSLDDASDREHNPTPLPSYQALDILAEARANPYLEEKDYREIRDQVFREDPPPSQLRKLVKERAPEPPKKEVREDPSERLRKCLALAERLYGMLLEEESAESVARTVEGAIGGLRRLIEE